MANNSTKKKDQVLVNQKCSATFTFKNGKFVTDRDAVLMEVSSQGALITSKLDIDVRAIRHIESTVNGGQGQIIPFAGKVDRSEKWLENDHTCYFLKFQGHSSQAQRYINIHTPKSSGRRRKVIPSHNSSERKESL